MRGRRSIGDLIALLVGVLLALGVVEGLLRLFPHLIASDSLKREQRWRRTHVFVTRAPDNPYVHSPELGWDLRPGVRTDGFTTNSVGLRGLREYAPNRLRECDASWPWATRSCSDMTSETRNRCRPSSKPC